MLPILQLGPLAIQTPGLFLLAGLWVGLNLSERFASQRGLPPNKVYNLVFSALIGGIIGGRLVYALRYPAAFSQYPMSLLSINPGLLDFEAGVAIGAIVAWIYGFRNKLRLWPTLDVLTPMFASGAVAVGLAHLASGAAFGQPTDLPWGIKLWGVLRHPTQIYEILLAALIMAILWLGRLATRSWSPGKYFLAFSAWTACSRLIVEAFRGDSLLLPGGYRLEQVIAWIILIVCLVGLQKIPSGSPGSDHELREDVMIEGL